MNEIASITIEEARVLRRLINPYDYAAELERSGFSPERARSTLAKLGFSYKACSVCGGSGVVADRWGFWQLAKERGVSWDDLAALREIASEIGLASDQYPDRDPGWLPPEEEPCHACDGRGYIYTTINHAS